MDRSALLANLGELSCDEIEAIAAEAKVISAGSRLTIYDGLLNKARKYRTALMYGSLVFVVGSFLIGIMGQQMRLEPQGFFTGLAGASIVPFVFIMIVPIMYVISFLDDLFPQNYEDGCRF